ncbi:MAG: cell division ATP-binding protein FtsE [Candidatus Aminicenantes bacterium]|nr:cell division ATP-binding protein FtsE [Candidatus Aminicenantes bacterium]
MIELFHIWKQYQKPYWALSDVTLQIDDGGFTFITGPSGSGKSTLLKTIFREILPTEGQILINGVNILKIRDNRIYGLRRKMGIVFQDFRLMFHKSVFDNVAVPLQVVGVGRKEIRRRVFATLQKVNLHQKMWELPGRLSYGEQQRVAIARAVVNNPEIILADEPTGNLDPELAFEIVTLFKEISRQGATVIIGSHDRELIRHFGDNILFLQKGKIVGREAHP